MTAIERLKAVPLERLGQRVITLGMMDEVHGRPRGTAKRAFREHKEKLVEGRHYFPIASGELRTGNVPNPGNPSTLQPLLTERGYLVLVKTFRDDLAWQVQEELVEGYFRAREHQVGDPVVRMLIEEVRDLRNQMWGFFQGALSQHEQRLAALEQGQKRLRAGARQGLYGRQGGRQRLPRPRAQGQLLPLPQVKPKGREEAG